MSQEKMNKHLFDAVEEGNSDEIKAAIISGANISARDPYQRTPLHRAARKGKTKAVSMLLEEGADIECTTIDEETPLHHAARHGSAEICELLLLHKADPNAKNKLMEIPLHEAARNGSNEVAGILLQFQSHPNAINENKSTPLHIAALRGNAEVLYKLVLAKANVNAIDSEGDTPLHIACRAGYKDCVKILLTYGSSVSMKNQKGQTAADRVQLDHHSSSEILQLIQEYKSHSEKEKKLLHLKADREDEMNKEELEKKLSKLEKELNEEREKLSVLTQEIETLHKENKVLTSATETVKSPIESGLEVQSREQELEKELSDLRTNLEAERKKSFVKSQEIENLRNKTSAKENLKPPIQSYLENPEALVTVVESKNQLVNKKDVAVQFNYLTPINDTLHGVYVGDKKLFLIQGEIPQSFFWNEYGLRIIIPKGTQPPAETCEIAVTALIGGQFQLPEDAELISIVFAISVSKPLQQAVKLEIQHCAHLVTKDHASYLSFVTASHDQPVLPYQFQLEEGGHFSPDSQYGSISLSQFSFKGIVKLKERIANLFRRSRRSDHISFEEDVITNNSLESQTIKSPETRTSVTDSTGLSSLSLSIEDNTKLLMTSTRSNQEPCPESTPSPSFTASNEQSLTQDQSSINSSPPDNKYVGQVIYESKHQSREYNEWLMRFVVAKQLSGLEEFMKTSLSSNAEKDVCVSFEFQDSNGCIELILNEQKHSFVGWSIRPHQSPILIHQSDVDKYGIQVPPSCPSILITIYVEHSPETVKKIDHSIPLKGITPGNVKVIYIVRSLSGSTTSSVGGMVSPISSPELSPFSLDEVFRKYHSDLVRLMCVSDNRLLLASELFSAHLITRECYNSATDNCPATDTQKGTALMKGLMSIIDTQPTLITKVINILIKIDGFKSIAESMQHSLQCTQ